MKIIEEKLSEKDYRKLSLEFVRGKTEFKGRNVGLYIISKDNKFEYTWKYIIEKNKAYYQLKEKNKI